MSIQTGTATGEDKFTVRELLSTITDIPPFVATKGQVSSQTIDKNAGPHLAPFDDVIHVIRHSSFRVGSEQQRPVVSTENVELDVRSVSPGLRTGFIESYTVKPTASEFTPTSKDNVKPDPVELRPDLSEISVGAKEVELDMFKLDSGLNLQLACLDYNTSLPLRIQYSNY